MTDDIDYATEADMDSGDPWRMGVGSAERYDLAEQRREQLVDGVEPWLPRVEFDTALVREVPRTFGSDAAMARALTLAARVGRLQHCTGCECETCQDYRAAKRDAFPD